MEYSNPRIPEGINTTLEHPLKEFFILLAGILGVIAITVIILSLAAEWLAPHVPFSIEEELVTSATSLETEANPEINSYLQGLADKLAVHMQIPEDMHITVHYEDNDVENAYATIGGNIYIYRGLMQLLPNENALAMVVAHEIAHIKHRHPIIALGRGVVIGLFLASISGMSGDNFTGQVVNNAGIITLLTFNRAQEREADTTALAVVAAYYSHVAGADDLFKTIRKMEKDNPLHPPQFLSTHPFSEERIDNIYRLAKENNWSMAGEVTDIPANILKNPKVPAD